ncbi:probable glycosyltransferase At5g03795 isoform X2 [Magnolia sinica]|uniref:probable glycosyltransferase At5g03795 isoform X2 n=1 Tax=Magnolia sinica TaxID=86752 RepID=UPI002658FC69|nr:probable glycosyltransferase At5g03795 isoform X2 [Magnolia sinica]
MEYFTRCQMETRRMVIVMGIITSAILVFQFLALPYGNALSPLFPADKVPILLAKGSLGSEDSSPKYPRELPLSNDSVNPKESSAVGVVKWTGASDMGRGTEHVNETKENDGDPDSEFLLENDGDPDDDFLLDEDRNPDKEFSDEEVVDQGNGLTLEKVRDASNGSTLEKAGDEENGLSLEKDAKPGDGFALDNIRNLDDVPALENVSSSDNGLASPQVALSAVVSDKNGTVLGKSDANSFNSVAPAASNIPSMDKQATETLPKGKNSGLVQSGSPSFDEDSIIVSIPMRKNIKEVMPHIPIYLMNRILQRNRVSSRSMRPRWQSLHDQELLSAREQIQSAPIVRNDPELYAPVFRNVSMFKRSYELMERMLKVYVYKEGKKPIFHTPMLRGIYASEGWFMKLMQGNKRFVVKNPRKAHLFYLPFSSRFLQYELYVPGSHNRTNMVSHLKNYVENIAAKYPFWNRTGGADHFLAACHDWAPYETRRDLDHTIRALCNSDLNEGFKIGKDVSFPETFVRNQQNPLRDLGGKPASKRPTLAFFAGNMHGKVRPILLQYWENKDPDMKIFGPIPRGPKRKTTYIQYMKTSKYCICPRGYEVNSPRVVEAIFYECVPVIISDNFVPPFFEIFDWESFSVFVAEKDIPILKDILLSIPDKQYLTMQMRVKKVQQHFLWHSKPVKYDIFHMTLHSIWYNRVHQVKTR